MVYRRSFRAFGFDFELRSDSRIDDEWISEVVPDAFSVRSSDTDHEIIEIVTTGNPAERGLKYRGELLCGFTGFNSETAQGFEGNIQFIIADNTAPGFVLLHSGAVVLGDYGILFPAGTGRGKTTFTNSLLDLGASYCSDDCAVVDSAGMLHPYPTPLKLRRSDGTRDRLVPSEAGYEVPDSPVPVRCVAFTEFSPGARFTPSQLGRADAMMKLLENLFLPSAIRCWPEETVGVLAAVLDDALILKGERGESEQSARELISLLNAGRPS